MAKLIGKGTVLKIDVGAGLVAVGQVISITPPEGANETFEADTLDNADAGIPHQSTGRTEGGSLGFEVFFDPTSHSGLLGLLSTPDTDGFSASIDFTDAGDSTLTASAAGLSFGGGSISLNDGVKMSGSVKVDGVATVA